MATEYSLDGLLGFLSHASERGLMPAATAQALAVACRNVFAVLNDEERTDLRNVDLGEVVQRFTNKRARDFNPSSLATYGKRVRRAMDLFVAWRSNPAAFKVKTRSTTKNKPRDSGDAAVPESPPPAVPRERFPSPASAPVVEGAFTTSIPVRPGYVVTISGVPDNLTRTEAERLGSILRMLAVE